MGERKEKKKEPPRPGLDRQKNRSGDFYLQNPTRKKKGRKEGKAPSERRKNAQESFRLPLFFSSHRPEDFGNASGYRNPKKHQQRVFQRFFSDGALESKGRVRIIGKRREGKKNRKLFRDTGNPGSNRMCKLGKYCGRVLDRERRGGGKKKEEGGGKATSC